MRYLLLIFVCLFSFVLFSCSEPSMEDDARRAAELSTLSNQYSMDNAMNDAASSYRESQEIMTKYKKMGKFDEFFKMYLHFVEENLYSLEGVSE